MYHRNLLNHHLKRVHLYRIDDHSFALPSLSSSPRQYLTHVVLLLRGVEFSVIRVFEHALLSLFQVKFLAVFDELVIFL